MDFHFLVMEKSWKINVEKEGAPWGEGERVQLISDTGSPGLSRLKGHEMVVVDVHTLYMM